MLRSVATSARSPLYRRSPIPGPPLGKAPLQLPVFKLAFGLTGFGTGAYYLTKFISNKVFPTNVEEDIEDDSNAEEIIVLKAEENVPGLSQAEPAAPTSTGKQSETLTEKAALQRGFLAQPRFGVIAAVHVHVFEMFANYKALTSKAIELQQSSDEAAIAVGFSADLIQRLKKKLDKPVLRVDENSLELKAAPIGSGADGFIPATANHLVFIVRGPTNEAVAAKVSSISSTMSSIAGVKVVSSPIASVAWQGGAAASQESQPEEPQPEAEKKSSWWPWKQTAPAGSAKPADAGKATAAAAAAWPSEWLKESCGGESGAMFLHTARWMVPSPSGSSAATAADASPQGCTAHRTAITPAVFSLQGAAASEEEQGLEVWSLALGPSITAAVAERRLPPELTSTADRARCRATGMFFVPSEAQLLKLQKHLE